MLKTTISQLNANYPPGQFTLQYIDENNGRIGFSTNSELQLVLKNNSSDGCRPGLQCFIFSCSSLYHVIIRFITTENNVVVIIVLFLFLQLRCGIALHIILYQHLLLSFLLWLSL